MILKPRSIIRHFAILFSIRFFCLIFDYLLKLVCGVCVIAQRKYSEVTYSTQSLNHPHSTCLYMRSNHLVFIFMSLNAKYFCGKMPSWPVVSAPFQRNHNFNQNLWIYQNKIESEESLTWTHSSDSYIGTELQDFGVFLYAILSLRRDVVSTPRQIIISIRLLFSLSLFSFASAAEYLKASKENAKLCKNS